MKNALFILSDPEAGTEEATARVLNALGFADEARRAGDEVVIVFAGTGTRWPQALARLSHPAHALYASLREHVRGASRGCAALNGSAEDLHAAGVPLLTDNPLAGTPGIASFRRFYAEGWNVSIF